MLSTSLFLAGSALATRGLISLTKLPPEYHYSFEETCKNSGFNFTSHQLTTKDGYSLSLFQVSSKLSSSKKPVLMVHGLTQTALSFVANQSTLAPAFRLASAGYDVWLLNTRGNHYSRSHKRIPVTDERFWNWTAYHISVYDLPSSIDYILSKASTEKLHYIGHSQGGHVLLSLLSLVPEYNSKIALASLLAPVGGTLVANTNYFKAMIDLNKIRKLQNNRQYCFGSIGTDRSIYVKFMYEFPEIGKYLMFDRYDPRYTNDSIEHLPYYALKLGGGTSLMNLRYYRQLKDENRVLPRAYDYGEPELNNDVYGSTNPPVIDFSKVKADLALFFGRYDKIVGPNDGIQLLEVVKKDAIVHRDIDLKIDHAGFILSSDQRHFDTIIDFMDSYK